MDAMRIFIASPFDAKPERIEAENIINELSGSLTWRCPLKSTSWELEVPPGIVGESIQAYIDRQLQPQEHDFVLVIFRRRIGTVLRQGEQTGTEHELAKALEGRIRRGRPWTMVYFDSAAAMPGTDEERVQMDAVLKLKFALRRQEYDFREYAGTEEFVRLFREHLPKAIQEYQRTIGSFFDRRRYDKLIDSGKTYDCLRLHEIDGPEFSSFCPTNDDRPFRRAHIGTTEGLVSSDSDASGRYAKVAHQIFILRDPIRPFEIQIGEYRTRRYGRDPREVPFDGVPTLTELRASYPVLMLAQQHRWLRMVLAELLSDPEALNYMDEAERAGGARDDQVLSVISRNPSAPNHLRERGCRFCNDGFRERRRLPQSSSDTIIIRNDFPFGPYFHYVVFPREPVHAWDAIEEQHLSGMNEVVYSLLEDRYEATHKTVMGAAGIRIGFNSSIRHLVLGRRTRSSAGASVAHVHKQVWGMPPGSVNLADHLRDLCLAYESSGVDYLGAYLAALEKAKLVVWYDANVVLYVPFGQISLHEMQVMLRRPTRTFLDLQPEELTSLSKAEYVVSKLYGRLDINSFNEIMLSLPFDDARSSTFRLTFTFITREVDLAVSELSLLYVVDQHPCDTMLEIARVWPSREYDDLGQQGCSY